MKITSKTLAWACVILMVLYPVVAILVWSYLTPDRYGIMAALFAANAGTALLVGLIFGLPEFSHFTSRELRLSVVFIGVASGFMSATFWVADEVGNIWLRAGIISPVLIVLVVLVWFGDKVNKEGKSGDSE